MRRAILAFAIPASLPMATFTQSVDVTTRNQEIIRRNLDRINSGDAQAAAADWAEDARNFGRPVGRDGVRRTLDDIFTTFPDWRMEIVDMIALGDEVVVRCRVSGTHRGVGKRPVNGGMLVGVPPTGKRFEVTHIHWYTLRDGRIVEHDANRDDLGMMQQLGLLTLAAPPSAQEPTSGDAEAIVRSLDDQERLAALNRDVAQLERLWSANFTVNAPNNQVVVGRDANLDTFVRSGIINFTEFDRTIEFIRVDDRFAVVMGIETIVPSTDAPSAGLIRGQRAKRRFTNIWKQEGDTWRLYWRHANVIPAR